MQGSPYASGGNFSLSNCGLKAPTFFGIQPQLNAEPSAIEPEGLPACRSLGLEPDL